MAELRGLRASLPRTDQLPQPHQIRVQAPPAPNMPVAAATPSTVTASSPRLELPTPAPRRVRQETPSEAHTVQIPDASSGSDQSRPEWRPYAEPKIPQYQMGEDIENYLLRFERIAKTWRWPESEWACRLVPLLSGKALEAYTAMDEESAHSYPDLKEALLAKFDISPETDQLCVPTVQHTNWDFSHLRPGLQEETITRSFQVPPALPQTNEHPVRTLFVIIASSQATKLLCVPYAKLRSQALAMHPGLRWALLVIGKHEFSAIKL